MPNFLTSARWSVIAIPALVAGVLFVVFAVWFSAVVWLRPSLAPVFDPAAAHRAWQQRIHDDLSRLRPESRSQETANVVQDLLSLRVNAQDRAAHLALVLALTAFEHGSSTQFAAVQDAYQKTQL